MARPRKYYLVVEAGRAHVVHGREEAQKLPGFTGLGLTDSQQAEERAAWFEYENRPWWQSARNEHDAKREH